MKKNILVFCLGVVVSALVFVPFLIMERTSKYEHGKSRGHTEGMLYAAELLGNEFGRIDYDQEYNKLVYTMKTTEVVAVHINGVKTVRVTGF